MSNYRTTIVSSILDIPRAQWEAIWPYPAEGYNFYLSQEKSKLPGCTFAYITLYQGDTLVLIAPIFKAAFSMHLAAEGLLRDAIKKVQEFWSRFLVFKTIFCGGMVAEKVVIAIHPDHQSNPQLYAAFDNALMQEAHAFGASMIILKDIMDDDIQGLRPLAKHGYAKSPGLPMANLPIHYKDQDDYLAHLSAETRKNIRRKIKEADKRGGFEVQTVNNIDAIIDDIYALYLNVYNKSEYTSPADFGLLTKEFFLSFCTYMPEETIYFLYWITTENGKKLIGFNFCLDRGDSLMDKFIGMDYDYSYDYNLYFLSLLSNVKWCIENNKKFYALNQGSYEVKKKFGAEMQPISHMTKMVNPIINKFATMFGGA